MTNLQIALLSISIAAIAILIILLIYIIFLVRRANIVFKKVDYLIEDITYKAESLNVAVDAINKIANYTLTLDALTKKGFSSITKYFTTNKNFFYSVADKLKTRTTTKDKEETKKGKK